MTCSILDCDMKLLAKGLCSKHYYRKKRGQDVLGKSRFDRRPAIVEGDVVKLVLANGRGFALIDKEFLYLEKYKWHCDGRGYPHTTIDGKSVKIHHAVKGKPPVGLVTDHLDRNKLNNRLNNLAFVTQRQNMENGVSEWWFEKGSNKPGKRKLD